MEWDEKLHEIIGCIETSLQSKEEPIDENKIAQIAGCSFSFFQKVFSYMNGISMSEYIRLRRMTFAGYDLKSSRIKISDVSSRYGYDSPTAFTKAFRQFHGVSPREARKWETKLQICSRMNGSSTQQYAWRIEMMEDVWLVGVSENKDEWEYSVMITSAQVRQPGNMQRKLSEQTWAIFECRGKVPQALQNGWKYLKEEWLVRHSFQYGKCPALEWYGEGDPDDAEYKSQIWIPIILSD